VVSCLDNMPPTEFVYAYLQNGRPKEEPFGSLRAAVNQACEHIQGEEAMVFQIRGTEDLTLSGIDIIELFPDWLSWRDQGGPHPADALEEAS